MRWEGCGPPGGSGGSTTSGSGRSRTPKFRWAAGSRFGPMASGRYDGRSTVRACDLGVRFGAVQVLHPMSFECCEGEWVLLAGPTGAGKSTLLRALNGLCPPTEGRAFALGSWIPGRTRREAASVWKQTGTVLQEIALFETR